MVVSSVFIVVARSFSRVARVAYATFLRFRREGVRSLGTGRDGGARPGVAEQHALALPHARKVVRRAARELADRLE